MSAWRELHERSGCASANGLGMLAYQAALQLQWWWDVPIDAAQLLKVIT
jgi:shikimate 5-dehydrogenase